jgi:hypothetical protein
VFPAMTDAMTDEWQIEIICHTPSNPSGKHFSYPFSFLKTSSTSMISSSSFHFQENILPKPNLLKNGNHWNLIKVL